MECLHLRLLARFLHPARFLILIGPVSGTLHGNGYALQLVAIQDLFNLKCKEWFTVGSIGLI